MLKAKKFLYNASFPNFDIYVAFCVSCFCFGFHRCVMVRYYICIMYLYNLIHGIIICGPFGLFHELLWLCSPFQNYSKIHVKTQCFLSLHTASCKTSCFRVIRSCFVWQHYALCDNTMLHVKRHVSVWLDHASCDNTMLCVMTLCFM